MRRLLLSSLLLGAALSAQATTIVLRTLPQIVAEADQALQGRVVEAHAVAEGQVIFTVYTLEVSDWMKTGPAGRASRIEIRQPGGTVDGVTMTVIGAAQFRVGDELVLLTKDYGREGHQQVANLMQGALPVVTEAGLVPGSALRRVPGIARFPDGGPEDLDALKARIRELASAGARP